jgi:hypothetical protein
MTLKITETMIKSAIKDFLALKGIFSWPVTAGMGSYKGAPDRIMHLNGQVVYLEVKTPKGQQSDWQGAFHEQCKVDGIAYHVVRSVEDVQDIVDTYLTHSLAPRTRAKRTSSGRSTGR